MSHKSKKSIINSLFFSSGFILGLYTQYATLRAKDKMIKEIRHYTDKIKKNINTFSAVSEAVDNSWLLKML